MEDFLGLISLDMYNFIQKLIKAHAEYEKENECCGLIGLNNLKEIQVVPCENTHITREKNFEISPKSFVEKSKGLEILSIYHSHTISGPQPSEFDKLSARNWQLPFYIYSIKTKEFYLHFPENYEIPKLDERDYVPDLRNCFRFVVDYYILNKILSYFELNFALTKDGQAYSKDTVNIVKTFLKINKFKKIKDTENLKLHDLILFEIDGYFSHFGVYCGDNQFFHHEGKFLSRKTYLDGQYFDRIHSVYRHISCI